MLKMTIDNEEVVSKNNFTIKEEMLSPSSTILNNTYPKEWENDKDYISRFYYPKDYAKLDIQNFSITPEEAGTTIDINGSATLTDVDTTKESRVLSLKGQTSQTGTPTPTSPIPVNVVSGDNYINICGKNLFKEWLSGTVNVSTGEITSTARNRSDYIKVQPSTTYTLWREDTGFATYFIEYNSNKEYIREQHIASASTTGTFTTSANTGYVILYQYTSYAPTNKAMLEVGSTSTTYEPYIGNSYPIYLGVENLFDITTATAGTNLTKNGDIFTSSALSTYGAIRIDLGTTIAIKNGEDYYISYDIKVNSGDVKNMNYYGRLSNGSSFTSFGSLVGTFNISNQYQRVIWKTSATADFIANNIVAQANGSITNSQILEIKNIQVSKVNGSYTEYGITPIELCNIPNTTYRDRIFKAVNGDEYYDSLTQAQKDLLTYGSWYLHKEIGKVVLDGSENITSNPNGTNSFYIPLSNSFTKNDELLVMSNSFKGIKYNDRATGGNNTIYAESVVNKATIRNTTFTTLELFTTWLSTNKPSVYYVLATPTTTLITDTTLLEQLDDLESQ